MLLSSFLLMHRWNLPMVIKTIYLVLTMCQALCKSTLFNSMSRCKLLHPFLPMSKLSHRETSSHPDKATQHRGRAWVWTRLCDSTPYTSCFCENSVEVGALAMVRSRAPLFSVPARQCGFPASPCPPLGPSLGPPGSPSLLFSPPPLPALPEPSSS